MNKYIMDNAIRTQVNEAIVNAHVFIDTEALQKLAEKVIHYVQWYYENASFSCIGNHFSRNWHKTYHSPHAQMYRYDWLFVLHTMNFSLWIPNSTNQWTVNGQSGFWALTAAIDRAIEEGRPIWDPFYYSSISIYKAKIIFRSDNKIEIPLLFERVRILRQIGLALMDHYNGTFAEFVRRYRNDSYLLFCKLCSEFDSYQDKAYYDNYKVTLCSKATTLVIEVNNFLGQSMDAFSMHPTIFVDYRVPQVFLHCGVLSYSKKLLNRIKEIGRPLEHGSKKELEIRVCSMYAAKILCELVMTKLECCTHKMPILKKLEFNIATIVSNFLWGYRVAFDRELMETVPLHDIRSIYF